MRFLKQPIHPLERKIKLIVIPLARVMQALSDFPQRQQQGVYSFKAYNSVLTARRDAQTPSTRFILGIMLVTPDRLNQAEPDVYLYDQNEQKKQNQPPIDM